MHKSIRSVLLPVLLLMAMTGLAVAGVAPPAPDVDASAWAQALYTALVAKQWGIVAGVALIGLVYPLRRFGPSILKTPFGGLVLALLTSLSATFGIALAAGAPITLALAASAIATAATAAGVWEWLKSHIPGVEQAAAKASTPAAGS